MTMTREQLWEQVDAREIVTGDDGRLVDPAERLEDIAPERVAALFAEYVEESENEGADISLIDFLTYVAEVGA